MQAVIAVHRHRRDESEEGPEQFFGEMSLLGNQPTSATVRAVTHTTLLFLARSYVERLAMAIPEMRSYFESVAAQRARDNNLRLRGRAFPSGEIQIDPSQAILL